MFTQYFFFVHTELLHRIVMPFIEVSFYNEEHRDKLRNTPKYQAILELVENGFTCSDEDLWTYALFKEQKPFPGYENFQQLKLILPRRWEKIKEYYELNNRTVRAKFQGAEYQEMIEELGIGAALALVSHVHGLTEADWNIIPISRQKDLDFSIDPNKHNIIQSLQKTNVGRSLNSSNYEESIKVASDGERFIEVEAKGLDEERFIEVEAKGSYVNKRGITSSISKMRSDIEKKTGTKIRK